jgi:hypothetical protein
MRDDGGVSNTTLTFRLQASFMRLAVMLLVRLPNLTKEHATLPFKFCLDRPEVALLIQTSEHHTNKKYMHKKNNHNTHTNTGPGPARTRRTEPDAALWTDAIHIITCQPITGRSQDVHSIWVKDLCDTNMSTNMSQYKQHK